MIILRNKNFGVVANACYNADCLANGVPTEWSDKYNRMRAAVEKSHKIMGSKLAAPVRGIVEDYDNSVRAGRRLDAGSGRVWDNIKENPGALACLKGQPKALRLAAPLLNMAGRGVCKGLDKIARRGED